MILKDITGGVGTLNKKLPDKEDKKSC